MCSAFPVSLPAGLSANALPVCVRHGAAGLCLWSPGSWVSHDCCCLGTLRAAVHSVLARSVHLENYRGGWGLRTRGGGPQPFKQGPETPGQLGVVLPPWPPLEPGHAEPPPALLGVWGLHTRRLTPSCSSVHVPPLPLLAGLHPVAAESAPGAACVWTRQIPSVDWVREGAGRLKKHVDLAGVNPGSEAWRGPAPSRHTDSRAGGISAPGVAQPPE